MKNEREGVSNTARTKGFRGWESQWTKQRNQGLNPHPPSIRTLIKCLIAWSVIWLGPADQAYNMLRQAWCVRIWIRQIEPRRGPYLVTIGKLFTCHCSWKAKGENLRNTWGDRKQNWMSVICGNSMNLENKFEQPTVIYYTPEWLDL